MPVFVLRFCLAVALVVGLVLGAKWIFTSAGGASNPIAGCDAAQGHVVGVEAVLDADAHGTPTPVGDEDHFGALLKLRDSEKTDPSMRAALGAWVDTELALSVVFTTINGNDAHYTKDQQTAAVTQAFDHWTKADDVLSVACGWKVGG
jgi:hypothetical protein